MEKFVSASRLLCLLATCLIASSAIAAAPSTRAERDALSCDFTKESCCERWVSLAKQSALDAASVGQEVVVDVHRIDRWRRAENRPYCAIREDVLAREKRAQEMSQLSPSARVKVVSAGVSPGNAQR